MDGTHYRGLTGRQAQSGDPLTRRQQEILDEMLTGKTNKEIADTLFISPDTVRGHLTAVYAKLGVAGESGRPARAKAIVHVYAEERRDNANPD